MTSTLPDVLTLPPRTIRGPGTVMQLPAEAVARVAAGADGSALRRAVYGDAPGHPVVIGHRHWVALARDLRGGRGGGRVGGRGVDRGAGAYLEAHGAVRVECGDLWDGMDVDLPELRT